VHAVAVREVERDVRQRPDERDAEHRPSLRGRLAASERGGDDPHQQRRGEREEHRVRVPAVVQQVPEPPHAERRPRVEHVDVGELGGDDADDPGRAPEPRRRGGGRPPLDERDGALRDEQAGEGVRDVVHYGGNGSNGSSGSGRIGGVS
jgi:hypothetical protein